MKKWLLILFVFLSSSVALFAQNDEPAQEAGKIQSRMVEYIQKRLGLSKNEAEKFSPVFFRYFREFAQTHRENRTDKLVLQQKIIDLRLKYRTEFRQIMDEDRANKVYKYEDQFRQEAIRIIKENRRDRLPPRKNNF
jgi:hypothetical protein